MHIALNSCLGCKRRIPNYLKFACRASLLFGENNEGEHEQTH
jgi:hypothetical protein